MEMESEKLEAWNFLSYDHFVWTFMPGKHLIVGNNKSKNAESNGSGKSSLIDALSMCIYDKTERTKNPSKNKKGNCKLFYWFKIGDNSYRIERYIGCKDEPKTVKFFCNEEDISDRLPSNTQKKILDTFTISYDLFISNITVMQGLPISFSELKPTPRKALIEDLVCFSLWDSLKTRISKKLDSVNIKFNVVNEEYAELREKMISKNSELETLKKVKTNIENNSKDQIVSIKNSIKGKEDESRKLIQLRKDQFDGIDLVMLRTKLNKLANTIYDFKVERNNNYTIIHDKMCPTCKREYPSELLSEAEKRVADIDVNLSTFQDKHDTIKHTVDGIETIETQIGDVGREINGFMQQLNSFKTQNSVSDEDINTTQAEVDSLNKKVNEMYRTVKELNELVTNYKYIINLLLPSSEFRSIIINNYLGYINSIICEINSTVFDSILLSLVLTKDKKGIDIIIKNSNGIVLEFSEYSGGEKRRLDLIIIMAFQKFMLSTSSISTNMIVYDELMEGLDRKGIEQTLLALDMLYDENLCFYIISHSDKNKELFDNIIIVNKDENNNSSLEINNE